MSRAELREQQLTSIPKVRPIEVGVTAEQLRSLRSGPDSAGEVEVNLREIIGDSNTLEIEFGGVDAGGRVALQGDFVGAELHGGVDADVAVAGLADDVAVGDVAGGVLEVGAGVVGAHAVVVAFGVDFGFEGDLALMLDGSLRYLSGRDLPAWRRQE